MLIYSSPAPNLLLHLEVHPLSQDPYRISAAPNYVYLIVFFTKNGLTIY